MSFEERFGGEYELLEGIRADGAMAASPTARWPAFWAHIFVDCQTCTQSVGLRFRSNTDAKEFSEADARKLFQDKGWVVVLVEKANLITCPACQAKAGDLVLNLKHKYFMEIKSGKKTEEYRIIKRYWDVRIRKPHRNVIVKDAYPKAGMKDQIMTFKWRGYDIKEIEHEEFKGKQTVYAIKLEK